MIDLIDDEPRRLIDGAAGRARVEKELAWRHQAPRYLGVYDGLLARHPERQRSPQPKPGQR